MAIALRYAARSDVGLVRTNNQDSAYAGPHLLVVADGMGGHAGGDIASSITVGEMSSLDGEAHSGDTLTFLEMSIKNAHDDLLARVEQEPALAGMGTTVTALLRSGNRFAMAHIGDSRGYLMRDGELTQVTADHSFVQHLVDTGRLTPEEAERHPQRSVLLRVLGDVEADITPDMSMREARVGDRWLLCSDGLSGVVSFDTLAQTLETKADVGECAEALVQYALRAGAPDNVTCVVADVVELDDLGDGEAPSTAPQVVGAAAVNRNRPTQAKDTPAARAASLARTMELPPDALEPAAGNPDGPIDPNGQGEIPDETHVPMGPTTIANMMGEYDDQPTERPRWQRITTRVLLIVGIFVVLGGLATAGYLWTQTQYYLGVTDNSGGEHVAIFQGVPQSIGPISLSHVVEVEDVPLADLPPAYRTQLEGTIPVSSVDAGREQLDQIVASANRAQPTPTPTPSQNPSDEPSPTRTSSVPRVTQGTP